jgi:hypothetical protein
MTWRLVNATGAQPCTGEASYVWEQQLSIIVRRGLVLVCVADLWKQACVDRKSNIVGDILPNALRVYY